MVSEVDNTIRVAVFVVVPSNELNKVGIERDTSLYIENTAACVTYKVR